MAILNYTTGVSADKTVGEIQKMLGQKGASRVSVDYQDGRPSAVSFTLLVQKKVLPFRLPCNIPGVLAALIKQKVPGQYRNREHAARVSWRILKDWIAAQVALVEAGQAEMAEVFMPYMLNDKGQSAYQELLTWIVPQLPDGKESEA